MKKIFNFIFMAAAAIAAMSCVKEENPVGPGQNGELVHMTFTATADAETKVFYDGESRTTQWKKGDEIAIITTSGASATFTANTVSEDGFTAVFEGEIIESDDYYAVYPARAYKGNDLANPTNAEKGGRLYIDIPAVQTAVAGTFDPTALVSVAQTTNNTIVFKNICSVVQFSFNTATDVKSIRFTMNGNSNLAGNENIYISNLLSHTWGDAFEGRTSSNMITLNAPAKGFEANTDYYFTLRPFIQKDTDTSKGINFYVEYNNGVKVRQGSKAFTAGMNKILPLGVIDAEDKLSAITPYEAYNLGFDVMVAGKAINKATYGEATLITKDSNTKGLNNNGVYFINSDAEGVGMNSGKSIIAIGNNPEQRSNVSRSGYSYIPATTNTDYWVLSNINLSITSTSTYSLRLNGSDVCEMIIMDNCSSNVPTATQYIYGDANNKVKELIIKDSEFLVEANAANNFLNFAATQTVDNLTFDNNVFYSADITSPAKSFTLVAAGNTTVTDLTLNRNTFYGAYLSTGSIVNCKSTDVNVTKNIFGLNADATTNVFVIGGKISDEMNFNENGYIKNGASNSVLTVTTGNAAGTGTNNSIASIGIDTSLWNPSEGKFGLNYGFGATR